MNRRLITILIVSQIAIDLAFVGYIWADMGWKHEVTNILQTLLEQEGI